MINVNVKILYRNDLLAKVLHSTSDSINAEQQPFYTDQVSASVESIPLGEEDIEGIVKVIL